MLIFLDICVFLGSISVMMLQWHLSQSLSNGLCILLGNRYSSFLTFVTTIGLIVLHITHIIFVPIIYWKLYYHLKTGETPECSQNIRYNDNISPKRYGLMFQNHPSWFTSTLILLMILLNQGDPYRIYIWYMVVCLPLNPIINPIHTTCAKVFHEGLKRVSTSSLHSLRYVRGTEQEMKRKIPSRQRF